MSKFFGPRVVLEKVPLKYSVELTRRGCRGCRGCGCELDEATVHWAFAEVSDWKQTRTIHVYPCCEHCAAMDAEIEAAAAEGRRYTEIYVVPQERSLFCLGERCICGAVTHARLGRCVQCSIAHRMLNKAQAESRLITKLLKELRAEVKEQQKQSNPVEA